MAFRCVLDVKRPLEATQGDKKTRAIRKVHLSASEPEQRAEKTPNDLVVIWLQVQQMWGETRTLSLMHSNISDILRRGPYLQFECVHTHTHTRRLSLCYNQCKHTLTAGGPPPDTHIEACSKNAARHKQHQ